MGTHRQSDIANRDSQPLNHRRSWQCKDNARVVPAEGMLVRLLIVDANVFGYGVKNRLQRRAIRPI